MEKAIISWTPSLGADFYDVYKIDSDGLLVNIALYQVQTIRILILIQITILVSQKYFTQL